MSRQPEKIPLNRDRPNPGDAFDLIRVHSRVNRLPGYHRHDFMEIFWVVEGTCMHVLNGNDGVMETGDICFLRPFVDSHRLTPKSPKGFAFINFVIPTAHYQELCLRHPDAFRIVFPSSTEPPSRYHLPSAQLEELNARAEQLFQFENNAFQAETFLFTMLQMVTPLFSRNTANNDPSLPEWLKRACTSIREQEYFCRGTRAFAEISGRCHEHVARETRKYLNQSPIQIVNAARMQYARKQLLMTHRPIEAIISDCGFEDVSQFYKLFKKSFGQSPVRFRKLRHTISNKAEN